MTLCYKSEQQHSVEDLYRLSGHCSHLPVSRGVLHTLIKILALIASLIQSKQFKRDPCHFKLENKTYRNLHCVEQQRYDPSCNVKPTDGCLV